MINYKSISIDIYIFLKTTHLPCYLRYSPHSWVMCYMCFLRQRKIDLNKACVLETKVCLHFRSPPTGYALITSSSDNTVKLWSATKIFSSCDDIVNSYSSIDEMREDLDKEINRPFSAGEGPIETVCTAVSK